jgi:hypothetical protein
VLQAQQQRRAVLLAMLAEAFPGLHLNLQQQHSRPHLSTTSSAGDQVQILCWVACTRAK